MKCSIFGKVPGARRLFTVALMVPAVAALLAAPASAQDQWVRLGAPKIRADVQASPVVDLLLPAFPPASTWQWIAVPEAAAAVLLRGRLNTSRSTKDPSIWQVMDFCNHADPAQCIDNTTNPNTRFTAWKVITAGGTNGARGDEWMMIRTVRNAQGQDGFWWRWNKIGWVTNNPGSSSIMLWIDMIFDPAS